MIPVPPAVGLRSPTTLLDAWDAGRAAPDLARGAVVPATAAARPADDLVDLPVSELATLALRTHRETYGDRLDVVMRCESCDELLDVPLSVSDLIDDADEPLPVSGPRRLSVDGHALEVRTPTTRDLLQATRSRDPASWILARCVVVDDGALAPDELDDAATLAVDELLEQLAAPSLSTLVAPCPQCGDRATAVLDPAALLWQSVDAHAPALLAEVAHLAVVFGWSQESVLAMSHARRAAYLELAGA